MGTMKSSPRVPKLSAQILGAALLISLGFVFALIKAPAGLADDLPALETEAFKQYAHWPKNEFSKIFYLFELFKNSTYKILAIPT